jgi:GT2 family glycosyltransferase
MRLPAILRHLLRLHAKDLPRKVLQVWSQGGWRRVLAKSIEPLRHRPIDQFYSAWIRRYDTLTDHARDRMRREMAEWAANPLISVIMAVRDADQRRLEGAIASVRAQLYPHWELCICVDGSTSAGLHAALSSQARADHRIHVRLGDERRPPGAGMNDAVALARGDLVALLDSDDLLPVHALYWIAKEFIEHPAVDLVFSDEDSIDADGKRSAPRFKPGWNPALMLSCNAVGRLAAFRRTLVEQVGGFRPDVNSEHDLLLRCARATERIRHIPRVLYHWRARALDHIASAEGKRAIAEHIAACGTRATVSCAGTQSFQVDYALPSAPPRVSILIPTTCDTRFIEHCLASVLAHTTYCDFEILLLVNERHLAQAAKLADRITSQRLRLLAYPDRPFNYSWVNNWGARQASGELLCFLNDDTTVITPDWLERLAARTSLPGVAAAGAKLLYPDNTIQHAGVILGLGGVAGHAGHGLPRASCGYLDRFCLEQDVSCVTAACMVMRASVFTELGGFDEALAVAFNDVDLCIRARAAGWRIIWTPTVELYHHESATAGRHDAPARAAEFAKEYALMRKRWGPVLDADPFYNPNLSLRRPFHLAFPPRG